MGQFVLTHGFEKQIPVPQTTQNASKNRDIRISVEAVYVDSQSAPESDRYVFAYTVLIQNNGDEPAKLLTRHWIITDADGQEQEVHGEGVVGEQPRLEPGDQFQYTSWTVIRTPVGSMHGEYQMVRDDGTAFDAEIAPFQLAIPNILH